MSTKGKVKWFDNPKGYGFIEVDGIKEDVFFHYSEIQMDGFKTLPVGTDVEFNLDRSPKGLFARSVDPVGESTD